MLSVPTHNTSFVISMASVTGIGQGSVLEAMAPTGGPSNPCHVRVLDAIMFTGSELRASRFLQMQILLYHGHLSAAVIDLYHEEKTYWLLYVTLDLKSE